jgi:hypothetical protein
VAKGTGPGRQDERGRSGMDGAERAGGGRDESRPYNRQRCHQPCRGAIHRARSAPARVRETAGAADAMPGPTRRLRYAILGAALVAALAGGLAVPSDPVSAGPATPTPDAPPPADCTVAPLPFARLNATIAAATPAAGGYAAPGRGEPVPDGSPAPPATEAAVRAVVREFVACQNAGELLRAYALYTDRYLARLFARQGAWDEAAYHGLATPLPNDPGERSAILGIRDARVLPDGRVGATVVIAYPSIPMPKTFFFTFADEGVRWAIDDILGEISFSVP